MLYIHPEWSAGPTVEDLVIVEIEAGATANLKSIGLISLRRNRVSVLD